MLHFENSRIGHSFMSHMNIQIVVKGCKQLFTHNRTHKTTKRWKTLLPLLSLAFFCPSLSLRLSLVPSLFLSVCPGLGSPPLCSALSVPIIICGFLFLSICLPPLLYLHFMLIYYRYDGAYLCACAHAEVCGQLLKKRGTRQSKKVYTYTKTTLI